MRYLIAYMIGGEAGKWHNDLAKEISDKFDTWKIYEHIPPHLTLYRPFEMADASVVKALLQDWVKDRKSPGGFLLSDYGYFQDKVVFAGVIPDAPVTEAITGLREKIKTMPEIPPEDFPVWNPHITLARLLSVPEINNVWDYVAQLPKPNFTTPFDSVTLLRVGDDQKWIVEETFSLQ